MKKLLTVVFTMLLAGTLGFAQAGGGSTGTDTAKTKPAAQETSGKKKSKGHKGGKKSKKGSSTTTPPPK